MELTDEQICVMAGRSPSMAIVLGDRAADLERLLREGHTESGEWGRDAWRSGLASRWRRRFCASNTDFQESLLAPGHDAL